MNTTQENLEQLEAELSGLLDDVLANNPAALKFFCAWKDYTHAVDDLIDEDRSNELIIKSHVLAAELYSSNFWYSHGDKLFPTVLTIANAYADSVAWENSGCDKRQHMADMLRTTGNEMILLIIGICSGWDNLRKLSPKLRMISYLQHHDNEGNPV